MKLQSAMEYLMTYGWAILVIAIVMVALFGLGILGGGGSSLATTCLANSGFSCSTPIFSASTGNLVVTVGQATGTSWTAANIVFVPTGTSTAFPCILFFGTSAGVCHTAAAGTWPAAGVNAIPLVTNGQQFVNQQEVTGLNIPINTVAGQAIGANTISLVTGQEETGSLWVQYYTNGGGPFYSMIAAVTLKAS